MKQFLITLFLFSCIIVYGQQLDFKHINFKKADSIASALENHSLNNLPLLAYKLTNNLNTQIEKFRAIHTWVCLNIESDHSFGEKTIRKRKKFKNDSIAFSNWNSQVQAKVFERLLKDRKTICSGYAYLLKELTTLIDIPCEIVDGYSRTVTSNVNKIDVPNHSWNAVKLNDKWYLVDATLASGYFYINLNKFIKNYNDGYFLAEPELFSKNHYPLDKKWLLLEKQPTIDQFVEAPLVYGETYKYEVIPVAPIKLITKVSVDEEVLFSFKISDKNKIDKTNIVFSSGLRSDKIEASSFDNKKGLLNYKYHFTKKGQYDVHLKIDEDIVVSYTIEVEKGKSMHNPLYVIAN
ncbi:Transglutaminase-like superfamily protein [Flaviramulus basaltis]|uniref:Transglutaminase-like superfamily protein n=1 Tax=Flaviramulus basaltis TaxID=369401 RepID=A0A1K2IQH2_9FLAO|nr:transglutaminase domain-containing protein [Flaviramulus basaltis]SFZ94456.1 Transglutaminase-like superfamily protein [Flaviramulus basaltis]